ncbi:MAG: TetR/AcrR family transcriptional regulator [Desulfovibrio sp.]|jgi:AcrR family transcriptional regulator|nr:TetR/AcrR family transcriptional regulator [Desulfovibrio sp.]
MARKTNKHLTIPNLDVYEIFGKRHHLPLNSNGNPTWERIVLESTVLFCMKGYEGVTIRDIALRIGMTPGALYNHFPSKEKLWDVILDQAVQIFHLYLSLLAVELEQAVTFEEVLDAMIREPRSMKNPYSCYIYSLILAEQFRNIRAGKIYSELFLNSAMDFHDKWLAECVRRGFARPFDTKATVHWLIHNELIGVTLRVQELECRLKPALAPEKLFLDWKDVLMRHVAL